MKNKLNAHNTRGPPQQFLYFTFSDQEGIPEDPMSITLSQRWLSVVVRLTYLTRPIRSPQENYL